MIARMEEGRRPKVARFNGEVAVYAMDGDDQHGFLFSDAAAVDTATRILAAVADLHGETNFSHQVDSMKFQVFSPPGGEPEGVLTFRFNGAPITATLDPIQIAELAAAFAQASAFVDRPAGPRPSR